MKRIASFVLVVALLVVGFAPLVAAQTPSPSTSADDTYVVQPGDNLWTLSGVHRGNSVKWGELMGLNPFLKEPGRMFERPDGTIVVLIRPGERLRGVTDLGITAEPFPIEKLTPVTPAAPAAPAVVETIPWSIPWLGIMAGMVLLIIVAVAFLLEGRQLYRSVRARQARQERERQLGMDPVTSGTPYVPGGIPPNEPERLAEHFERQAAAGYAARTGTAINAVRVERIGPIQRGMLSGEGMVRYLGQEPQPRRFDPPVPGYQARFRFPDGTEEVLQSLAGCMNPVAHGGETLSGFTFTPAEEVVPVPTPEQPVPTRPAPVLVPAAARATGEQTIAVIGGLRIVMPAGFTIRTAESGEITLVVTAACDVRVQQLRRKATRPRVVRTAASGTSDAS